MDDLLSKLRRQYPQYTFKVGNHSLCWSSQTKTILYPSAKSSSPAVIWGIFHELGHAELRHTSYRNDIDLVRQETAAWDKASEIAAFYSIDIDQEHVVACLDSYREWLHRRSACPQCGAHGVQQSRIEYICINCRTGWNVGEDRFCRTYRKQRV